MFDARCILARTHATGSQLRVHRNRVLISLSETKDRAKAERLTVKSVRGSSFPRSNERMPPRAFLLSAITMDRGIPEREIGFAGRDTTRAFRTHVHGRRRIFRTRLLAGASFQREGQRERVAHRELFRIDMRASLSSSSSRLRSRSCT